MLFFFNQNWSQTIMLPLGISHLVAVTVPYACDADVTFSVAPMAFPAV
jgi:hypothetical protein